MNEEQTKRLEELIGGQNPVRVSVSHPQTAFLTPGVIRQRFAQGDVDERRDGGMAVRLRDGSILSVSPN